VWGGTLAVLRMGEAKGPDTSQDERRAGVAARSLSARPRNGTGTVPEGHRAALGVMQRGLASRVFIKRGFIEISTSVSEGQSVLWRSPPIRRDCAAASPHLNERISRWWRKEGHKGVEAFFILNAFLASSLRRQRLCGKLLFFPTSTLFWTRRVRVC